MLHTRSALLGRFKYNLLFKIVRQKSSKVSTHSTVLETEKIHDIQNAESGVEEYVKFDSVTSSARKKLPKREPLVKNFFVGIVDKELLAYPEVISREDMSKLEKEILVFNNFFKNSVDINSIDATRSIPKEIRSSFSELGLYGFDVRDEFNGKDWRMSESLMASEPETLSPDIALSLISHRAVVDIFNEIGTTEQRQRYMKKLAIGETIATEAIFEFNESQENFFNTVAEYDSEGKKWLLNGEKSFVICGPSAGLFLVVAQTNKLRTTHDISTTLFIVDSSNPGVTVGDKHLTLGLRGVEYSAVKFKNVELSNDCVIGNAFEGHKAAEVILRSNRLRTSLIAFAVSRNALNILADYCVHTKQCGQEITDMEIIRKHLSEAMCSTYAMESMIYFTAGLLDEFSEQDVALEAAITKYYTVTRLFDVALKFIDVMGPKALLPGQVTDIVFRNSVQLCNLGESTDSLRLFIALSGLQHAGNLIFNTVKMSRNPLHNPKHIFSKFFEATSIENPKTKMRLGEHLHPSLDAAAQCLEHSIARLQMCVELLLTRHGSDVVQKHMEIKRLTEMITHIYSMFASVSRASRSYCIGLTLADHEMLLASTICMHGSAVVKTLSKEIFSGNYGNNDINFERLSKQIIKSKGYYAVHPLSFNF